MMLFPIVILEISDDDDRAFMKQLYMKYHLMMFKMARASTDSIQDAEDAVSDACVSLIHKISVLRRLECNVLEGYIISTVKNAAFALHRKKKIRREVGDGSDILEFVEDENAAPDKRILEQCSIDELMKAVDALSAADQAVIRMRYFQKLSDREIAVHLGVRESTVRSKLMRARRRIFILLEETRHDNGWK